MNKENKNLISKKIISKIEKGEVKTRPRYYFILKSFFICSILFLLFIFILFFSSLIVFVAKENNFLILSGMGFCGFRAIILHFPWYLFLISLVLIIIIEVLGKNFKSVYRKPLIYSFLLLLFLTFFGSIVVDKMSFHQSLFKMAKEERLMLGGGVYRSMGNIEIDNTYFGIVLEKKEDYWAVELDNNKVVQLKITNETKGRRFFSEIKEGSDIVFIGEREGDVISVSRFRKMNGYQKNER